MADTAFVDLHAEAVVIAGTFRHGRDAFVDADDLISTETLSDEVNQVVWACAREHFGAGADRPLDFPTLLSVAKRIGLSQALADADARRHVKQLYDYPVELPTVRHEAGKLLKLRVGKELYALQRESGKQLLKITGDESLNHIVGLVESPIFSYSAKLGGEANDTKQIGVGIDEWLENVLANPRDNIGVPTPYTTYNRQIGGGLRRRSIAIIGARPKQGKSTLCDDIALHVAGSLGIPVFNLDTEMSDEEHWARMLANLTGIPIERIEKGQVTKAEAKRLREKAAWLKTIPYYYKSVIDETFEDQVAAMRRWIVKDVGVDGEGRRNDCLVIYDYLQLTDPGEFAGNNFKEYQLLGFQMVALTRLIKKYDVPILSFLQINRDGIDKETTAVAAGSDRIIWKCGNFSILKRKSAEEVEADGEHEGNAKLITLIARHGPGAEPGDWINLKFDGATSKFTEGKTNFQLLKERRAVPSKEKGFATEFDQDETFEV